MPLTSSVARLLAGLIVLAGVRKVGVMLLSSVPTPSLHLLSDSEGKRR
jgi:hypothetical protein